MRRTLLLLLVAVAGCRRGGSNATSLMPLDEKRRWTYESTIGLERRVFELRVSQPASVSKSQGYELSSEMGLSRMVWEDGNLLASEMAGTRFQPPLPLIAPDGTEWNGTMMLGFESLKASAKLTRRTEKVQYLRQSDEGTFVSHKVTSPQGQFELRSWYLPGIGLVRQEWLQDDKVDRRIVLLAH